MTKNVLEISICEHSLSYQRKNPKSPDVDLYLSQNYAPTLFDVGSSGKDFFPETLPDGADLLVLSEHDRDERALHALQSQANRFKQIIIAPAGFVSLGTTGVQGIYVIAPGQPRTLTEKISFDAEDQGAASSGKLRRGKKIHLFETPIGTFSVLNCHDYTHSDLIQILLLKELDFLIVTSNNPASRLFREYALSDMHQFFGYIILNNVASFGGSGVYGPIARLGDGNARVNISGTLFEASGPSFARSLIPLPTKYLSELRRAYKDSPDSATVTVPNSGEHQPILPPESFTSASPHYRGALAKMDAVETIDLDAKGYRFSGNLAEVTVTIAQLFAPPLDAYLATAYRPSTSKEFGGDRFVSGLRAKLKEFDRRQAFQRTDFLLLPEVFLPECLEKEIRKLVRKHNVIVLAGLEYEPQEDESLVGTENAKGINRARIYVPTKTAKTGVIEHTYEKMTRSQYDARWRDRNHKNGNFPFEMKRGSRLVRFTSESGVNFGILVCYDISHFEIISKINEERPLDVLFVLSHNPFAELYRNICLASCHRFYQFIAMCNVADYGGSGVFGPMRTRGNRRTLAYLGQRTEAVVDAKLDITTLRDARSKQDGALAPKTKHGFQRKPGRYQVRLKPVV